MWIAPFLAYPRLRPAGDQAYLSEFGPSQLKPVTRAVMAFHARLRSADLEIIETAPTIRSVLIRFDPFVTSPNGLRTGAQSSSQRATGMKEQTTFPAGAGASRRSMAAPKGRIFRKPRNSRDCLKCS